MSLRTNPPWRALGAAFRGKAYRAKVARPRRWLPAVDDLEGRLAPAVAGTLYVVGDTLVYNGNFANNVMSLSGSGGSLSLTDSAGSIVSDVPGMLATGSTVAGTIPSYIQSIAVNGQDGTDTLTVASGFATTRDLILSASLIVNSGSITTRNLTETAGQIELGGAVSTAAGPLGGSATFNGPVVTTAATTITTNSVTDGTVTFNGSVTSLYPLTIDAGDSGVVGTDANLVLYSDFTVANAASIHLAGATIGGNILLTAQGGITLAGTVTQTDAADSVVINANQGGSGSSGFDQAAGSLITTGTVVAINVGGTGGAQINNIMTAPGGGVTISAGGGIQGASGPQLNVETGATGTLAAYAGPGGINLTTQTGSITASTASAAPLAGAISVSDSAATLTANSLTTTNGSITLSNSGNLVVAQPITAGGVGQTVALTTTAGASTGNITINAGQTISASGSVTVDTPGAITSVSGSTPAFSAPTVDLTAQTGISGTIGPLGTSLPLDAATVSASTNTGGIALANDAALTVDLATANAGAITITTPLGSVPSSNDLVIKGNVSTVGAAITLDAGDSLSIDAPSAVSSNQPINLNAEYNLTVSSGSQVASSGTITINGAPPFPLGALPSTIVVSGTLVSSSSISISGGINNDAFIVNGTVVAPGGLTLVGSLGADTFLLTPSTSTAYTIDLSYPVGSGTPDGFADLIVVNAPSSTIATTTPTSVTFTAASGYKSWTLIGFNSAEGDTVSP